tara:strand:+ start:6040 stop:6561 length:522 start_codon:yes stop_codon:yes gene_type:complete
MPYYHHSTQVPNEIFDEHLPYLNQTQLKVLLVVIRQTLGWIHPKTKQRKSKDWISISFFSKKTRLTHKSISLAISSLVYKNLIVALDNKNQELRHPKDRRGKKRIYYAYAPLYRALKRKTCVKKLNDLSIYPPDTKQTQTKRNTIAKEGRYVRQTDAERYQAILEKTKKDSNE